MADDALAQAVSLIESLIENARKGNIVPFRLTGQLEEVAQAIGEAQESVSAAAQNHPAPSADEQTFLAAQAAFMSHAIHELRGPMTSIRGYADMMGTPGMGELSPMQQQFLETIRANARRMEGLLTDVSDISKIRGKTLKISAKMDMFKNIAMTIEKQMRPLAAELGRTLTFDVPQGLPYLNTDGELLTRAFVKLVENALRYHKNEQGEVAVVASGDGNKLIVRIQDNGVGMTPDELRQLGTIYFRSEDDIVRSYKGSGLGVPIAFGIIEALGGRVSVASEPDQGTTFTVTLTGMS